MKVGLFIPCYVDAFMPEIGVATLELLERLGVDVRYPLDQTCCGQPMANSGCHADAAPVERQFLRCFEKFDYVVTPSGSCAHHVRERRNLHSKALELSEFLHDVLKVREFPWASFPHRVGLHIGCAGLRGLGLASTSEISGPRYSKPRALLERVRGVQFVKPDRPDECCGFGGTFSVTEEPVSARMGYDKVNDHKAAGAQYIVTPDPSCMMHQRGCAERLGLDLKFIHLAQVLNGARE
jgi:L-lactate dehydrogenase complex protein LldE